jgi:hypothetical protein
MNNHTPQCVTTKIVAKILQIKLQSTLMEAINSHQSAFVLVRYILNNIILTHETISWAKKSKQPIVFSQFRFFHEVDWASCSIAWIGLGF